MCSTFARTEDFARSAFFAAYLAALAQLFHLTGATVNFVFDLASAFVPNDRILSLLCSKIAAVTVNDFFLTG